MPFRTISVSLTASNAELSKALRAASSDVTSFDTTTRKSAKNVTDSTGLMGRAFQDLHNQLERGVNRSLSGFVATAIGGYAAGRALNTAIRDVIGGAVELDARMRNVNSISGLSEAALSGLTGQVIDLSKELPQSANTLAEGLYDITSSGFQGAAGLDVLRASAQAATAGLASTQTAAQAITAVLNAYGLSASHAGDVSDALFQTVNVGVVSFDQLAGTIGDVVGIASAANIDINQVGSAIATMTLSGINAAEAGTSLNRVIQSLLQPSDALAQVYKQLGYESGQSALATKGLRGVMDDLRVATGGNVTTLLDLFTDVRAARGAFALMAQDGQAYTRVSAQIDDANNRQGATHRALAEQMKSVSAQWDLFKNRTEAAAITVGQTLLPTILDLLNEVTRLAREGVPPLEEGLDRLTPFFRGVRDIGSDVVDIFGHLLSAATPLAKALLGIGGAALIGTLNGLATAISAVTGFIDDNKTAFGILAAFITAAFIPQVLSLTVVFNKLIFTPVIMSIYNLLTAAEGAGTALTYLRAGLIGLTSIEAVATLGISTLVSSLYVLHQSADESKAKYAQMVQGVNATDLSAAQRTLDRLAQSMDQATAATERNNSVWGILKGTLQVITPFTQNTVLNAANDAEAASKQYQAWAKSMQTVEGNVRDVATAIGHPINANESALEKQLESLAQKSNIDLSQNSAAVRQQLIKAWTDLGAAAGTTTDALAGAAGEDINAMQAIADAVQQAMKSVSSAFSGATDVMSLFDPAKAAQAVATAQDQLRQSQQNLSDTQTSAAADQKQAQQALTDYQAQLAGKTKITVAEQQKLRDLQKAATSDGSVQNARQLAQARQDVADATANLTKAQADAGRTGTLSGAYAAEIQSAQTFESQIRTVLERGLDPQLVARLLEAGPEKAAPMLQSLVSDHTGRLIKIANAGEETLREINAKVVEITRLTTLAVQSTTDTLTRDLPNAVKIEQAMGGAKTLDALTAQLHLSPSEIQRIAAEFGVTLPKAIQDELNKHPITPVVVIGANGAPPGRATYRAAGGLMTGPGTSTSDSIVARVSTGEFVQRAAAVDYYGVDFMRRLNAMQVPRFADGGYAGVPRTSGMGGGVQVVRVVEQPVQYHTTNRTEIGEVRAHDYADFTRQMKQRARLQALAGIPAGAAGAI